MSVKKFAGAAKKEDAKKALGERPVLVLFYMIGCPHCEANKSAWEDLKKEHPEEDYLEIEADATPDDEGVSGFPTMKHKKEDGSEKVTSGEKHSAKEIADELEVSPKKGSSRRRRALRRTHRGRNRKLRHRTLRNHVSLRQKFVRPSILPEKF